MLVWDKDGSIERKIREQRAEEEAQEQEKRLEQEKQIRIASGYSADPVPPKKPQYDSPYAMENSTATFLYIIAMLIGTLFYARVLIYITATIIWWKYITRHKER
jgi:hypothetical protein